MQNWLKDCHIHVIGLGLMGASLAMALRGKAAHLSGADINPEIEQKALQDGVVSSLDRQDEADIIVIAIPADYIVSLLPSLQAKPDALVIDLGSTKSQICAQMDALPENIQAVGGHPMCGLAENGYANAVSTLYAGARFILCETARTTDKARSLCEQLIAAVGAHPLWMEREYHDQLAGAISHLPHLMSFALMRLAMRLAQENNNGDVWDMAAGGFDGATRLARTDEAMITGMFRTNAAQIRELVSQLQAHLDDLTLLLDDPDKLRKELDEIVAARRLYTQQYGERMIT